MTEGWAETVCIVCTDSSGATVQKDSMALSQSAQCSNSAATSPPTPTVLAHDGTKADTDFAKMLDPSLFWTLTPNTCSFPTCEIMAAECTDAYGGTNIKIVNGKEIHGRLNIDAGYIHRDNLCKMYRF